LLHTSKVKVKGQICTYILFPLNISQFSIKGFLYKYAWMFITTRRCVVYKICVNTSKVTVMVKGQGQICTYIFVSAPYLSTAWRDFYTTLHECSLQQGNVSCIKFVPIPQMSRSWLKVKRQICTYIFVSTLYLLNSMQGCLYNFAWMFTTTRSCVMYTIGFLKGQENDERSYRKSWLNAKGQIWT
jgi:hypothetical protein